MKDNKIKRIKKLLKIYRGCVVCKSVNVCWNWYKAPLSEVWGHECWDCENVQETGFEVKDGIPYTTLRPKIIDPKIDYI